MERRTDIYKKREKYIRNGLASFEKATICKENKEILNHWRTTLKARDIQDVRIAKLLMQMAKIHKWINKPFNTWSKFEVLTLAQKINECEEWAKATKVDYRRITRQFFRWYLFDSDLVNPEEYQPLWREIKRLKIEFVTKDVNENNIILEEDLNVLLSVGAKNSRNKAFISVLHEGGLRIEEILNMKKSHIVDEGKYLRLKVTGKTGERTIILVISVPYLKRWLQDHPYNAKDDYFIWSSLIMREDKFFPLDYKGAVKLLQKAMQQSGLNKPCNPHHFRHSRLTINGAFMSDSDLCAFAGWSVGSKCVQVYVHTTYNKVRDSLLRMRGLDEAQTSVEKTKQCGNCLTENLSNANFCACCGNPITTLGHKSLQETKAKANNALEKIFSNPELMQEFQEWRSKKT